MYFVLWEFAVKPEKVDEFESRYGSSGTWSDLFQKGEGFMSTELLKDNSTANRYVTVDRWVTKDAHEDFLIEFDSEYADLKKDSAGLTDKEIHVGSFERMR
jgi:heme-degrading monooxygenase HmoA